MQAEPTIPHGYCHCGCGEKTKLARETRPERGHVKDEPLRYLHGHAQRSGPVRYIEDPETGCWTWQWFRTPDGYGRLLRGLAHHAYYIRAKGPIPKGLQIDHLCRNRACVNPDHLEAVTQTINVRRGRSTKLTADDVRAIRKSQASQADLGRAYGVTAENIHRILKRETWKEID